MPLRVTQPTRPPFSPELLTSAKAVVASAGSATFAPDPLLGPGLSLATSIFTSVVKRHGNLIESAIAEALERSDEYIVLRAVTMPITRSAEVLVAGNQSDQLRGLSVSCEGPAARAAVFDLIAINIEDEIATIVEVKRGSGETELKKRRHTENVLRAGQLQGKAYLRTLGYEVREVNTKIIDYYGRSRFKPDLTITQRELDAYFKVPVVATVEAVTNVIRRRLHADLPRLIGLVQGDAAEVAYDAFATPARVA